MGLPVYPPSVQFECIFFGPFREAVGEKSVLVETDADTVGGLLRDLEGTYPDLDGQLIDENSLVGKTVVTANKRDVRHLEGLDTILDESSAYRLVPSVYGG